MTDLLKQNCLTLIKWHLKKIILKVKIMYTIEFFVKVLISSSQKVIKLRVPSLFTTQKWDIALLVEQNRTPYLLSSDITF